MLTIRKLRRRNDERGASLMLAIILMVILAGMVVSMSLLMVNALKTSSTTRDATYFDLAITTASNDALRMANNPATGESITNHIGESKAVQGHMAGNLGIKWQWYLEPLESAYADLAYTVVTTAYRDNPSDPLASRTMYAVMASVPTDGARRIGDAVYYRPTPSSIFAWGVFGDTEVALSGTTRLRSFNSRVSGVYGTDAAVGTNNFLDITPGVSVGSIMMANSRPGFSLGDRCTGDACSTAEVSEATYGMDVSVADEWIQNACKGTFLPAVSGSAITLNATNPNCFESLSLSGNVAITYTNGIASTGAPAKVYVRDNITVAKGTKFNANGNTAVSGAMVMHMFVGGNTISIGAGGAAAGTTDFRALVTAPNAACVLGDTGSGVDFWGALICKSVNISGNSIVSWDVQTKHITPDASEQRRIWEITNYQNS